MYPHLQEILISTAAEQLVLRALRAKVLDCKGRPELFIGGSDHAKGFWPIDSTDAV